MSDLSNPTPSRREALKATGAAAAASAFAGLSVPHVHAAANEEIRVALIGCGGRGTGAAENALSVKNGPIKLVALADVFQSRIENSYNALSRRFDKQMEVPGDRRFVGFDGYKQAIDCLRPGDVAILATPPAFRWPQFSYALAKGVNVFMEKPVTVDAPTSKRFLQLADESEKKGIKVGVGLMCRHCDVRRALFDKIKGGAIGDLTLMRAYRMAGPTASAFSRAKPNDTSELGKMTELLYQIRRFHSFLWLSGGAYSDFLIHNIDEACWMKDAWPVKAQSNGGRHYRGDYVDQNFDSYSTEFTFADGTKLYLEGRTMAGCKEQFATYVHGTKGSAVVSAGGHIPAKSEIFKGHSFVKADSAWTWGDPGKEPNPYQLEWDHLIDAIRTDKPYNEARRGVEASLVTAMGRMSAHTGREVTREQFLNCDHEFAPDVDKLTLESPAPLILGKDGKYPIPEPGRKTTREF